MFPLRLLFTSLLLISMVPSLAIAEHWKLVWSDEFDRNGLPDPAKWDYEEGFVRNREAQYYTRARAENARVENGVLVIEGRREKIANPAYRPEARTGRASRQFAEYTSASLITRNRANWRYGRVEVRAKLPQGRGVWPAIWMLGTNMGQVGWPASGEIDIMEFVGHTPGFVHATVHFRKDRRHLSSGSKLAVERPFDDFHIYAVEWFRDHMDFYFDGEKYHTFPIAKADDDNDNPFGKPQYLLINLALGGTWGGAIDNSIFPQKFLIDYVRVYQEDEVGGGAAAAKGGAANATRTIRLFNGRDLEGWYTYTQETKFENPGIFVVENGMLRVNGGDGRRAYYGGIITKASYQNYRLALDYKWAGPTYGDRAKAARDSGILLHCVGSPEGASWPPSIEANIMEGDTGSFWLVSNRKQGDGVDDDGKPIKLGITVTAEKIGKELYYRPAAARVRVTGKDGSVNTGYKDLNWKDEVGFRGKADIDNPFGEWTHVECVCRGDTIDVFANGKLVNRATETTLTHGRICLQAEAADVLFKNIELTPLD